jgi:rhodanese-related sulfurtransferase
MESFLELSVSEIKNHLEEYVLVDVREPHELLGPDGRIEGSILVPLGPALLEFLEGVDPALAYVFICRSGVRSAQACALACSHGMRKVYNMKGGMVAWRREGV